MITYCETCQWCKPWRSLLTLFGLLRKPSFEFAKCWHPHALKSDRFVRLGAGNDRDSHYYCAVQNDGHCPDYQQKEPK